MDKEKSKTIEYTTKKEILYKELLKTSKGETICVYKQVIYINNKEISSSEGICNLISIQQLTANNRLTRMTSLTMFKKNIEDYFLKNNPNTCEFFKKLESYEIKKPYSYMKNNDNWGLYIYDNCSWSLFDYNGEELPKGIFFSYIDACVDNSNYDLEEMLELLKNRNDVVFKDNQNKILSIPSYNCNRYTHSYLEFLWIPNPETFKKVKEFRDSYNRYNYIIENIFGLTRREYVDESDGYNDNEDCNMDCL